MTRWSRVFTLTTRTDKRGTAIETPLKKACIKGSVARTKSSKVTSPGAGQGEGPAEHYHLGPGLQPSRRDHCGESDPRRGGEMVDFGVHHLPLPGGAPAPKKWGSLSPPSPPPVRRHDAPCEGGTHGASAARRVTSEDLGNPCQSTSNAGFRAQPGPQRRGPCPLIVQICSCQNRAPPACKTLLCDMVTNTAASA